MSTLTGTPGPNPRSTIPPEALRPMAETFDGTSCAPWCMQGDQHQKEILRGDQNCEGPQLKVILGLEDGAPPIPLKDDDAFSAPGITVYAFRRWYSLPTVKLNLYRPTENGHRCVDADVQLTPNEAVELAANLLAAVRTIWGVK